MNAGRLGRFSGDSMAARMPWMKWFSADWLKDTRLLSLEARGLWMDMLMLMDQSPRRGYLQHASGKPITPDQLARLTGCSAESVSRLLRELEDSGVYSSSDEGIYNRRMVRDERIRRQNSENGRKGGNPSISGRLTGRLSASPSGGLTGGLTDASDISPSGSNTKDSDLPPETKEIPPSPLLLAQFVEVWNALPGVCKCLELSSKRRKAFQSRISDGEQWRWRDAVAKFPLPLHASDPDGWKPTIDWFLRPDTVTAILEGKYDWRKNERNGARDYSLFQEFAESGGDA